MLQSLDHLVLTITDLEASRRFWCLGLGMHEERFGEGRMAFVFGAQKLNIHLAHAEAIVPRAHAAVPGSADLCFLTDVPVTQVATDMARLGYELEIGPVERTGAMGPILSIYIRDPDKNLVEVANQLNKSTSQEI